jgi:hypothetical protein
MASREVKVSVSLGYRVASGEDWCPLYRDNVEVSSSGFEMPCGNIIGASVTQSHSSLSQKNGDHKRPVVTPRETTSSR